MCKADLSHVKDGFVPVRVRICDRRHRQASSQAGGPIVEIVDGQSIVKGTNGQA